MSSSTLKWIIYHIIPLASIGFVYHWPGFLWLLFADFVLYVLAYIFENAPLISVLGVTGLVIAGIVGIHGAILILAPSMVFLSYAFPIVYAFFSYLKFSS